MVVPSAPRKRGDGFAASVEFVGTSCYAPAGPSFADDPVPSTPGGDLSCRNEDLLPSWIVRNIEGGIIITEASFYGGLYILKTAERHF